MYDDQEVTYKSKILLPNLRYKKDKDKGKIFFKAKNPIRLKIRGKILYKDDFELVNLKLSGTIEYKDIKFICTILQEENENGLFVNIEYKSIEQLDIYEIRKFAKYFEGEILEVKYDKYDDEVDEDAMDDDPVKIETYDSDNYEENDNHYENDNYQSKNNDNTGYDLEYDFIMNNEPYYDYENN
jgi:hypothetical protein